MEQNKPATLVRVMQTAGGEREHGEKHDRQVDDNCGQYGYGRNWCMTSVRWISGGSEDKIDDNVQADQAQKVQQEEIPELRARGAASKFAPILETAANSLAKTHVIPRYDVAQSSDRWALG